MAGRLYICATPIGNMEDITVRVIKTLRSVDLIAAEDTRQTLKICNRYRITRPLTSYHEHNERTKSRVLLEKLKAGENIALVSNAGTPGLSDPGHRLIKACIEADVPIEILPGPAAALAALVISGLPTDRFAFEGFLPRRKGDRRRALERLASEARTIIIYESPHRILLLLQEMEEMFKGRRLALVRELTKKFEEVIRGNTAEILSYVKSKAPRGELVLIVEGAPRKAKDGSTKLTILSLSKEYPDKLIWAKIDELMKSGLSKRDAVREIATATGLAKRVIYEKIKDRTD